MNEILRQEKAGWTARISASNHPSIAFVLSRHGPWRREEASWPVPVCRFQKAQNDARRSARFVLRAGAEAGDQIVELHRAKREKWRDVQVDAAARAVAKAFSLDDKICTGTPLLVDVPAPAD